MYVDGELIERDAAVVSALDRGLLYGYGLFETMRSYGGRVFRLKEHYERLREGAAQLGMAVPMSMPGLNETVTALLERNGADDVCLRLTVTAGTGEEARAGGAGEPKVILQARSVTGYPPELYRRGMAAVVSAIRRNEKSPLSRVKSLNYLDNLLAREDAREQGADEAILLNTRGLVAEGSVSNLFLVMGKRLVTPSVQSGALPGITRQVVLEAAGSAGLEAVEGEVEASAIGEASEAFLTNSVMEVMPLTRVEGRPVGSGVPGPATERLSCLYREMAEA
jgi:branched-chain amino acid aminotransferase group I